MTSEEWQKEIEKAKQAAGARSLHQIDVGPDGEEFTLLVVPPTLTEWTKFISELDSGDYGKKISAHKNLVLAMAKYPAREAIGSYFEEKYASMTGITDKIGALVGAGEEVRIKKL